MRSTLRAIFSLLLCIALAVSLGACTRTEVYEPDSAVALWEKIDQSMNSLKSMEMTVATDVTYYSMGYQFSVKGSRYVLSAQDAHYNENETLLTCEELSLEQKMHTVDAYYDGKMYIAVSDGVYNQKLCSELTHEEYDEDQGESLTDEINIVNCTASEFAKEGEGWKLKFSGYTKKTIDHVLQSLGVTEDMLGTSIVDMEVNITADKDFYVTEMKIMFHFPDVEGEEISPDFSVTAQYKALNSATFDTARLNTEEFTLVDDVRVLNSVAIALAQRQNASSGSFKLELSNTQDIAGKITASKETDTVSYGRKNGAYYYQITSQMEGQNFEILYQNGEQTVTVDGQTHTAEQTEAEAKIFVDGLIDAANYKSSAITGIEKQAEGVYVLTSAALDLTEYAQQLQGNDMALASGTQQITVTFREGKLVQISGKSVLSGTYQKDALTVTSESNVVFEDPQEG